MKQIWRQLWLITLTLVLVSVGRALTVQADEQTAANFTVSPVYPQNQVGGKLGYFQLKVQPGQRAKLSVKLVNYGNQAQRLMVQPTKATTSDAGQINYVPVERALDKSAQTSIPKLMSARQTVTVAPKTTKRVTFTYQIPKTGFRGTLLGSLYIRSRDRQTNQHGSVRNRYAMVVGLSMSERAPRLLAPKFKVGAAQTTRAGTALSVATKIRNVQPTYFRQMQIISTVTRKGHKRVLFREHLDNGSMAPTSAFTKTLRLGNKVTQPGWYTVHFKVMVAGKTWYFDRNFKLSAVAVVNRAFQVQRWYWWLWLVIGLLILIIVGGFFYWLGRHRKSR